MGGDAASRRCLSNGLGFSAVGGGGATLFFAITGDLLEAISCLRFSNNAAALERGAAADADGAAGGDVGVAAGDDDDDDAVVGLELCPLVFGIVLQSPLMSVMS